MRLVRFIKRSFGDGDDDDDGDVDDDDDDGDRWCGDGGDMAMILIR